MSDTEQLELCIVYLSSSHLHPQSCVQHRSIKVTALITTEAILDVIPSDFPSYSPLLLMDLGGWVKRTEMGFLSDFAGTVMIG